jgi:hypothetical protein
MTVLSDIAYSLELFQNGVPETGSIVGGKKGTISIQLRAI